MANNRFAWVVLPVVLAVPFACSKTGGETAPVASQSAPVVQAPPPSAASGAPSGGASARPRGDRGPGRGGVVGMMLHASSDLELKDAQKATIEQLEKQLRTHDDTSKNDFQDYRSILISGVKEGKIDTAKLAPLKANMEKAMQARKDKDAETLNGLYAALEPAQRKALVAAIRAKDAQRKARAQEPKKEGDKPAEGDWKKGRTERLAKELGLDDVQQKSVEALFAKGEHPTPASMDTMREEMKKRSDAMLTAFEGDGFDAKKLDLWPTPGKKMGDATDRHAQVLSQLIAILKPEQREKLAIMMQNPPGRRAGYPVDDESGFGYFFDQPHHGEEVAPKLR